MNLTVYSICLIALFHAVNCVDYSDLVLVLDTSLKEQNEIDLLKDSMIEFIDALDIGASKYRIGIVEFGSSLKAKALQTFDLRDQNKEDLKEAIKKLSLSSQGSFGSLKCTGEGLFEAGKLFQSNPRDSYSKVVLLFTDGQSTVGRNVYLEAESLKKNKVEIFTYGTGSRIIELEKIATFPNATHSFFLSTYQDLHDQIKELTASPIETPVYIEKNQRAQIFLAENETRNFQVDVSSLVYDKNNFIIVEMTHLEGATYVDYDWLIKTNTSVSYDRPGFEPLQPAIRLTSKGYIQYYTNPPLNSLRLYLKIKGVELRNTFNIAIIEENLPDLK